MTDHHEVSDHDLLIEIRSITNQIKEQLVRLNGRVLILEQWKQTREIAQAKEDATLAERSRIRKGEWSIIVLSASMVGTLAALITRVLEMDLLK